MGRKFGVLHIVLIGVALALVIAGLGFGLLLRPKLQEITELENAIATLQASINEKPKSVALSELEDAKKLAQETRVEWEALDERYSVFKKKGTHDEIIDVWWQEAQPGNVRGFEPSIREYLARLADDANIRILYNLNRVPNATDSEVPKGEGGFIRLQEFQITMQGEYPRIVDFLRRLPEFNRLVQLGSPGGQAPSFNFAVARMNEDSAEVRVAVPLTVWLITESERDRMALAGTPLPALPGPAPAPDAKTGLEGSAIPAHMMDPLGLN